MTPKTPPSALGFLIVCGSLWGLAEAGLGLALESCAKLASGSIMTGVALFFIAAAWARTRRVSGPALVVGLALVFKLFDALLLGLPIKHGAVANPMFAFVTEGLALLVIIPFLADAWKRKAVGQAFLGGTSALLAVNLFPLVKFATGIPACVVPGGTAPLSLYYAPLAIGISMITVPLGFLAAAKAEARDGKLAAAPGIARWLVPTAAAVLCLVAQALLRLA
ncbi:MAG: hypothetical protein Q8O91_01020 [Candidatus Aminicenantes bacterium]|nr:hypothetical protein [Candidatus Aminicenantes bacterium]